MDPSPLAFTIAGFCRAHNVSHGGYYNLRKAGLGPVEMILGRKKLISTESAAAWRRLMESQPVDGPQPPESDDAEDEPQPEPSGPGPEPQPEPPDPGPEPRPEAA